MLCQRWRAAEKGVSIWAGGVGYGPKKNVLAVFLDPKLVQKVKLKAFGGNAVIYCIGDTDMTAFL